MDKVSLSGKVSIVAPCYNGESYVSRFLDSILNQTYPSIELIIVDDGSTDDSAKIIKSYESKFKSKGFELKYVIQENMGVGGTVNTGLKYITGDFFTWPNSDDVLPPDSLSIRVEFMQKHGYQFLHTDALDIFEGKERIVKAKHNPSKTGYLEDHIFGREPMYYCGGYMMTFKAFIDTFPDREINPSRAGQNTQLIYPLAAKYECGYLPEVTYHCYNRSDSLSYAGDTVEKKLAVIEAFREVRKIVLTEMGIYEQYAKSIDVLFAERKFYEALKWRNKKIKLECRNRLKSLRRLTVQEKIEFYNSYSAFTKIFFALPLRIVAKIF